MIWTVPNILTFGRVAAVPAVIGLLAMPEAWATYGALLVFVAASITDYVDGWLARKLNQTSKLGTMLDPIADKLLVLACLMMLIAGGQIAGFMVIAAIIILLREVFISGLREFLSGVDGRSIPVSNLAKWKTAIQMVALALLIVRDLLPEPGPWAADGSLWLAAALTAITGWEYARIGVVRILAADRGVADRGSKP